MLTLYFGPVSSSFFLFFLAYSQQSQIACLPYFYTWCGHSAMQVWNVLHAARWKCRTQKSPPGHHRTTSSGHIFAT